MVVVGMEEMEEKEVVVLVVKMEVEKVEHGRPKEGVRGGSWVLVSFSAGRRKE